MFPGGADGKTTLPEEVVSLQSGRGLTVLTEERAIAVGVAIVLSVSVVTQAWRGSAECAIGKAARKGYCGYITMSESLQAKCLPCPPAAVREAFRRHREPGCGRSNLGGRPQ